MDELHQNEQYFFDQPTLDHLASFGQQFSNPCWLCAPLLGQTLVERGCQVTILDIDRRFASLPGFQHYDIFSPIWLEEEFDLIVCDPPFFDSGAEVVIMDSRIHSGSSEPE